MLTLWSHSGLQRDKPDVAEHAGVCRGMVAQPCDPDLVSLQTSCAHCDGLDIGGFLQGHADFSIKAGPTSVVNLAWTVPTHPVSRDCKLRQSA